MSQILCLVYPKKLWYPNSSQIICQASENIYIQSLLTKGYDFSKTKAMVSTYKYSPQDMAKVTDSLQKKKK